MVEKIRHGNVEPLIISGIISIGDELLVDGVSASQLVKESGLDGELCMMWYAISVNPIGNSYKHHQDSGGVVRGVIDSKGLSIGSLELNTEYTEYLDGKYCLISIEKTVIE